MSTPISLDAYVAEFMAEYESKTSTHPLPPEEEPLEVTHAPKKEIKVAAGEVLFSDLFWAVPENDFAVRITSDVPEDFAFHIPATDPAYQLQTEEAVRLVAGIMDGDKILLTGPTGSGKSSLVKYVCSKLKHPFIRVNMSADVESSVLFGAMVVRDGATVWEDGPLTEAVRHGAVVLLDEWELMPPEISMGLQNLLEDGGYLYLKEKPGKSEEKTLVPHKNFRIICAGNTVGQGDDTGGFSGTMVQNSATLDRFTTTINLSYLSASHEVDVIRGKSKVSAAVAKNMVKLAGLVRTAYAQRSINLTLSPRTLINWAQKIDRFADMRYAFDVAFFDKLRDSDKKAVSELYAKVFGK